MSAVDVGLILLVLAVFAWGNWMRFRIERNALAARITAENTEADLLTNLGDLNFRISEALPDKVRYEIQLSDWGPDFTGEGDTLSRWRWVVVDADHALKQVFETPPHIEAEPMMLGNENTQMLALFSALEWIDKDQHPLASVVVS